jgi:hypothetical protein
MKRQEEARRRFSLYHRSGLNQIENHTRMGLAKTQGISFVVLS